MHRIQKKNRLLSLLLCFLMLFTSIPLDVFANPGSGDVVYVSVSEDGEYSDLNGTTMAYYPISLSALEEIDLEEYGLSEYAYNDEITALHLLIYSQTVICGMDWDVTVSGGPGSIFFEGGLFGFEDCNLQYYHNGEYPIDDELTAANGYATGATADRIVLEPGDFLDVARYSSWEFYSDPNAGFTYFYDGEQNISHDFQAGQGEDFNVILARTWKDIMNPEESSFIPQEGWEVSYSQTMFDGAASSVTTDSDGAASIQFSEAGTWYLWASGDAVGSPAYAKVTVTGSNQPEGPNEPIVPEEPTNQAPVLKEGYTSGTGEKNIFAGDSFTVDLTEVFTDADEDELTYTVSVDEEEAEELEESSYTFKGTEEDTVRLVFTASDGIESVSYTLTVTVVQKKAELSSLIIHTGVNPDASNTLFEEEFDPEQLEYTLATRLSDATSQLKFRARPNADGTTVSLKDVQGNLIKDITWTDGDSKYASFLTGGMNEFIIEVTSSDPYVEETSYKFRMGVIPTMKDLTADQGYWDSNFSSAKTEYTITLPETVKKVDFNAVPKSDAYTVTFNGAASDLVDVTQADKVVIVVSKDGISRTYTVTLDKQKVADLSFDVTPKDAVVMVYDQNNNVVTPNSDGSYTGMFGTYSHTYSVSKNGYVTQTGTVPAEGGKITVKLEKVLGEQPKEVDAYWPNFRGSSNNMAITDAKTPRNEDIKDVAVKWNKKYSTPSVQIIVDDALVVMSGTTLYKLDLQTGEEIAKSTMAAAPNFGYTPPTYAAGMIFCPLTNGTVQAFRADDLKPLWIYKDDLKGQSLSPITYSDGYIYTGFWNGEIKDANFVCISIADEDTSSTNEEKQATWKHTQKGGFYWAGSVVVGGAIIVGTDDGDSGYQGDSFLYSFDKETGKVISRHQLSKAGDQRSSIAYDEDSDQIYFTTKGGYLYRADVDTSTGAVSGLKGVDNQAQTTSTPVIYKGKVYYATGSGISTSGSTGNLVVADAKTLEPLYAIEMKGYPQSSVLLSNGYEEATGYIYLYSTYNNRPGGVSVIKLKPDAKTAQEATLTELYDAKGFEEYCITSIICGEDGTLYYKNDSGNVFAIGIPTVVNVENLISNIGKVSLESAGAISAARAAYDALGAVDKLKVSNYKELTAAEILYQEYVKADAVDQVINAIGKVTLTSKMSITNARVAYNALSSTEKEKVTKLSILIAAEDVYKKLETDAVSYVEGLISKIGTVTHESLKDVQAAREAYDALSDALKSQVKNLSDLVKAEEAFDDDDVYDVEELIDEIGKVTVNSATRIKKARKAYDELSSAQKKMVSNYEKLVDSEEDLEEEQIEYVEDLIDSIGTVTLNSSAKINRARTVYNNLDDDLQDEVSNLDVLEAAEAKYKELSANKKATGTTVSANTNKTTTTGKNSSTAKNPDRTAVEKETTTFVKAVKELVENITEQSKKGEILDAILAYDELTEEEKAAVMKDGHLDDMKKQLAEVAQNDTRTGIGVSNCEWNVELVVQEPDDLNQIQDMQKKLDKHKMLAVWDIHLEDMITGGEHQPGESVLIRIPLDSIGDYSGYDGLAVAHYADDGTVEYLNCTVDGKNVVFNAAEFSYYAVVGYHGASPVEGLMTGVLNTGSTTASEHTGMPWLPWTIAAGCGLALIAVFAMMMKKNNQAEE